MQSEEANQKWNARTGGARAAWQRELADEPLHRDQALGDGIDGEKQALKGDSPKQGGSPWCDQAPRADLVAVQRKSDLRQWPGLLAAAGGLDRAGSGGAELEPVRKRLRHHEECRPRVHEKFDCLSAPGWSGQASCYVEKAHGSLVN